MKQDEELSNHITTNASATGGTVSAPVHGGAPFTHGRPAVVTEIVICGRTIRLGDKLIVKYADGSGWINGEVTELWDETNSNRLQARLSCKWCFHDKDIIEFHEESSK